ncbi:MAG: glycosyl transferase [Gammaproteobacteria bacterium]|nr:glycosyl transferase [Gammaproteobacteria bacterium]
MSIGRSTPAMLAIGICLRLGKYAAATIFGFGLVVVGLAIPRASLQAPEPTYLLLDRQQQYVAEITAEPDKGYGYWPITAWPGRVVEATLVREDRRFWRHFGVDPLALARAIRQNLGAGRRISGASTIAMQVARMQSPGKRSYFNKAVEAATAILLTARYGREEILRHYLRLVPYGNQIYGIGYAAERYFNKPAEDLSWAEIALLSAIPQSPTLNNPLRPEGSLRARRRAQRILAELHDKSLISLPQHDLALEQLKTFEFPALQSRRNSAMHGILKLEQELKAQRDELVGYRLETTLDLNLQDRLQSTARRFKRRWQANGATNVAVLVSDTSSGNVLAWLGSSNYFDRYSGAIDFIRQPRHSGSTLKPFIYALALDRGDIDAATLLPDLVSVAHGMRNSDNRFLGPLLPRQALANSRNVPATNLVHQIGIDHSYRFLQDLGLHDGALPARHYGAGLAVGALPVSLENLVQAYGVFANDGRLKPLRWFKQQLEVEGSRLLGQSAARQINLFLSDPQARLPSFPRMGTSEYPFPAAVKTGTSRGFRDAWTVAYSTRYTVGIWVGRADARPMRKLGGFASAAQLAQEIMLSLHGDALNQADLRWPTPSDYESVTLCSYTGKRANNICQQTSTEWVAGDALPAVDDNFIDLWIDRRNGLLAGQWTPVRHLEQRHYANLPALYRPWGKKRGLVPAPRAYSALDNPDREFNHQLVALANSAKAPPQSNVDIRILSPRDNLRVTRLPGVPDNLNSMAFHVELSEAVEQVLWYVDNRPHKITRFPHTLRWELETGEHRFQAELPYYGVKSDVITLRVD